MFMTLVLRGLVGLIFAASLARAFEASWVGYFDVIGQYLLIDGVIAAALGVALLRESLGTRRGREKVLGVVMLADAGARLSSGAALLYWPGLGDAPVMAVPLVAILGGSAAAVGLVEAWLTAREEMARQGRASPSPQFMAGPVGLTSVLSTVFGIAAILSIGSPGRARWLITSVVAAAAVVSLAMAWSAHQRLVSVPLGARGDLSGATRRFHSPRDPAGARPSRQR